MRTVWMPGGLRVEIHLGAADTNGALCLLVDEPPPGWTLAAHRHTREAETIHIVAGRYAMTIDGEEQEVGPGDTIHIPTGVEHAATLLGAEPGRRVITFTPAGIEEFFLSGGTRNRDDLVDSRALLDLAMAHGWQFTRAT